LAHKVGYQIDSSIDYPRHFTGHIRIVLKNGQVIEEAQPHARGSIEDPIPPEEIEKDIAGLFKLDPALITKLKDVLYN